MSEICHGRQIKMSLKNKCNYCIWLPKMSSKCRIFPNGIFIWPWNGGEGAVVCRHISLQHCKCLNSPKKLVSLVTKIVISEQVINYTIQSRLWLVTAIDRSSFKLWQFCISLPQVNLGNLILCTRLLLPDCTLPFKLIKRNLATIIVYIKRVVISPILQWI